MLLNINPIVINLKLIDKTKVNSLNKKPWQKQQHFQIQCRCRNHIWLIVIIITNSNNNKVNLNQKVQYLNKINSIQKAKFLFKKTRTLKTKLDMKRQMSRSIRNLKYLNLGKCNDQLLTNQMISMRRKKNSMRDWKFHIQMVINIKKKSMINIKKNL